MKNIKIIDCPHCCHWDKDTGRCNRIGEDDKNKGKLGVCWMGESEYHHGIK